MSRIKQINVSKIDYAEIAKAQEEDPELIHLLKVTHQQMQYDHIISLQLTKKDLGKNVL